MSMFQHGLQLPLCLDVNGDRNDSSPQLIRDSITPILVVEDLMLVFLLPTFSHSWRHLHPSCTFHSGHIVDILLAHKNVHVHASPLLINFQYLLFVFYYYLCSRHALMDVLIYPMDGIS